MPGVKRSKSELFRDHAQKRTQAVLVALRKLEECADRKRFEYGKAEADGIVSAIKLALDRLEGRLARVDEPPRFEWGQGKGE